MTRIILYRVEAKPQVISVSPSAAGGYSTATEALLGGPVACVPLSPPGSMGSISTGITGTRGPVLDSPESVFTGSRKFLGRW